MQWKQDKSQIFSVKHKFENMHPLISDIGTLSKYKNEYSRMSTKIHGKDLLEY